jgi:ATP-dependent Lon protease
VEKHGLDRFEIELSGESLLHIIDRYTREAGVRNLEREIASICRKLARRALKDRLAAGAKLRIGPEFVEELLGAPRYRPHQLDEEPQVGAAAGLAWTQVGGELFTTEVGLMPGKGGITLTGQLGDVMQESARAALSFVRSRGEHLGIDTEGFEKMDVHLHVPEGAIPKDGPSAGITIGTSLVSAFSGIPIRADLAMTGEITLRGRVLAVGGIKEKILAAYRAGIREVILPEDNRKDVEEIAEDVRQEMTFHWVDHMDQVLQIALVREVEGSVVQPTSEQEVSFPAGPVAH